MGEYWRFPTNQCDVCSSFVAWGTDDILRDLYGDENLDSSVALVLPGRPYSRACPRYAHRWYLCAQCPDMDFCGACAPRHEHPCFEGPVHDEPDKCILCNVDLDELTEYQRGYSLPSAPPRPHPDHPSADPPLYVEYFTSVNPGPHISSDSDGDHSTDDDYAYETFYPGPYKDQNGRQRRFNRETLQWS